MSRFFYTTTDRDLSENSEEKLGGLPPTMSREKFQELTAMTERGLTAAEEIAMLRGAAHVGHKYIIFHTYD